MREYTVDVLGTPYHIRVMPALENKKLEECDGYCDKTTHEIVVDDCSAECDFGCPEAYVKKVISHEIVHAFFFESGLGECWQHKEFGQEETTVDWIASMFPKLLRAFEQADAV